VLVDSSEERLELYELKKFEQELGTEINYLRSSPGLPHQRNIGIEFIERSGLHPDLVAFLDDDVTVPNEYFLTGMTLLQRDSGLVGVGAYDITHKGNVDNFLRRLLILSSRGSCGRILSSGIAVINPPSLSVEPTVWMPGHSTIFRWDALNATRFDASVRMYGEDVEMQLRISSYGQLAMAKDFYVAHDPSPLNRDQIRNVTAFSDGFRWRLGTDFPNIVKHSHVLYTTFALLAGEIILLLIRSKGATIGSILGHIDFLLRILRRVETQQLVEPSTQAKSKKKHQGLTIN
jgi:GT2 family glycosyltransferase